MIKLTPQRLKFVESATEKFGDGAVLSRSQINEFVKSTGISNPSWFKRHFGMDSQDIVYETETTLLEQNQTDWDEYESWIFNQDQVQVNLLNEEVV